MLMDLYDDELAGMAADGDERAARELARRKAAIKRREANEAARAAADERALQEAIATTGATGISWPASCQKCGKWVTKENRCWCGVCDVMLCTRCYDAGGHRHKARTVHLRQERRAT